MKRKANLSMVELAAAVGDEYVAVLKLQDFESVVLRSHLAAEGWLRLLLAIRLGVDTSSLPRLSFFSLASLALAGLDLPRLEKSVGKLNSLRNNIAHEFKNPEEGAHIWSVVTRLRRASGAWRAKWFLATKLRLLHVSAGVFIQVVKALKEKMSAEDYAEVRRQMPPGGELLLDDPRAFLSAMDKRDPRPKFSLPQVDEVTTVAGGRVAAIASVDAYLVAIETLGAMHRTSPFADTELAEIIERAEAVRERNRKLLETVKSWSDAKFEESVHQQYSELLPLIEWLRERPKVGGA